MRKKFLLVAALAGYQLAHAGGFLTNTNQSISFLRNPARDAAIGIDGAYINPAGIGFMPKGWHFSFNLQNVHQKRLIKSYAKMNDIELFAQKTDNAGNGWKDFNARAKAPVFPTLDLARVYDRAFFSLHMGVTGGGGKATFSNGTGMFESQVAMLPIVTRFLSPMLGKMSPHLGYDFDTYMRGRQYYMGGQLNGGYRLTDHLSVSAGLRVVYVTNNYYGYVRNMRLTGIHPQALGLPASAGEQTVKADVLLEKAGYPNFKSLAGDKEINCDQTGWGFTPVWGIDYQIGRWNFAAKYEMKTRLRLTNRSGKNTSGVEAFDDRKVVAADLPTFVTVGAQYTALADSSLRLSTGFHWFQDTKATQHNHNEKNLKGDGFEFLAGAEWDINKTWTISSGAQYTNYGLGKNSKFINNISFVTDSWSLGLGAKFKVKKNIAINIAYFKTFYFKYNKEMNDYNGLKEGFEHKLVGMKDKLNEAIANGYIILTPQEKQMLQGLENNAAVIQKMNVTGIDKFDRTNDVIGIGIDIDF